MNALEEVPRITFDAPTAASRPPERRGVARDHVRLLVATPSGIVHARFADLGDHLRPGDLLIVNDSATQARQIDADLDGHGSVVLHAATALDDGDWVVEIRTAPDAARAVLDAVPGQRVRTGPVVLTLTAAYPADTSSPTGAGNRLWQASVAGNLRAHLRRHGRPIAYGYLDRRFPLSAYQTVFGRRPGSAEMPSASRPFTRRLVTDLVSRGIGFAPITLHTGVSSQEAGEAPTAEWFEVSATTAAQVEHTRHHGGRVIAVGTTVTRALESAVMNGAVRGTSGWTDRVVTPAYPPRVVDGLISGWHDPQASHLLLVEAVAGVELAQAAYTAASTAGYAWHEFGDSGLFLPAR